MREVVLQYLACPRCRGDLALVASEVDGEEIVSGILRCAACAAEYSVRGGVPRMNEAMDGLEHVAQTFGFEWKEHLQGRLESDTVFGRSMDEEWRYFQEATGFTGRELAGAVVLDAGCGPGQIARLMARQGAALAVGMDINYAVEDAYRNCLDLPNVQIVQGNILAPPFKPGCFDLVWCNGVAHHTPDARGAHRSLSSLVRPGGTFYIWVYAKRFNPFALTKDVLDFLQVTRLPEPALMSLARVFSYLSLGMLKLYQAFHRLPPFRPRTRWQERKVRDRTLKELNLTWFDALSPDYHSCHSEAEVIEWFSSLGFQDIHAIEEPKVGVRGVAPASHKALSTSSRLAAPPKRHGS